MMRISIELLNYYILHIQMQILFDWIFVIRNTFLYSMMVEILLRFYRACESKC